MNQLFAPNIFGEEILLLRQSGNFQTTSIDYVDVPALTSTITNADAGDYILIWSYRLNNSKSNTNVEAQPRFNDLGLANTTVSGSSTLGGGLGEQFAGFAEFTVLQGDLKISLAIRRSSGNGFARSNTMNLGVYRIR